MSRMICYVAAKPTTTAAALGDEILAQFAALSRLHADGWGTAWLDPHSGAVLTAGGSEPFEAPEDLYDAVSARSSARIVYLRFASRGAPPAPENIQPFLRDGKAFQHNGLLAPREAALAMLTDAERRDLRGTTDSEIYFALARRGSSGNPAAPGTVAPAPGVAEVRSRFTAACLNAMLLTERGLHVVHASGSSPPPLAAFAERGVDLERLPPGHDADYNTLRTTSSATGARIVATTGVDQRGWVRLADESVFLVTAGGVTGTRVRPADRAAAGDTAG